MSVSLYVWVDWDGDGVFGEAGDDIAAYVKRIHVNRGKSSSLPYDQTKVGVGTCELELRNNDLRWCPENSSSPYYGLLNPGKEVIIRDGPGNYLFHGYMKWVVPHPHRSEQLARMLITDGMDYLSKLTAHTTLYSNYRAVQVVSMALSSAGWDRWYSSSHNRQTLSKAWIDGPILEGIRRIEDAETGLFLITASGYAWLQDRRYREDAQNAIISQWTCDNAMSDVTYNLTGDGVINKCIVTVSPITTTGSVATEWIHVSVEDGETTAGIPYLAPGQGLVTWAQLENATYAGDISDPIAYPTADYTYRANTASDNSGDDKTSDLGIALVKRAVAVEITLTNNGSAGFYVTLLKLDYSPYVNLDTFEVTSTDDDSPIPFEQPLSINTYAFYTADEAETLAKEVVNNGRVAQSELSILLKGSTSEIEEQIMIREIGDRITVIHDDLGINADFHINAMDINVVPPGYIEATWTLQHTEGEVIIYQALSDDQIYSMPAAKAGFCRAMLGDSEYWANFAFSTAGVADEMLSSGADVKWTDTDGYFCIYDAGDHVALRNRTGSTKYLRAKIEYA